MKQLIVAIVLGTALACAGSALAGNSTIHVSGVQSAPDTTAGAPGDLCAAADPETDQVPALSNTMAGSLIGCWYTDTFEVVASNPSGEIVATGFEHFIGCLDRDDSGRCAAGDPSGTLALRYTFEGKFDPETGAEIRGGCQHQITAGNRDFRHASGEIDFVDDVASGTSNYTGQITLARRSAATGATGASARAVAAAAASPTIC